MLSSVPALEYATSSFFSAEESSLLIARRQVVHPILVVFAEAQVVEDVMRDRGGQRALAITEEPSEDGDLTLCRVVGGGHGVALTRMSLGFNITWPGRFDEGQRLRANP
jgi:hypothetical protein